MRNGQSKNAWDLAKDINAKLTGGFRVGPRVVQRALQVLASAGRGEDRAADIISWTLPKIKCVGPDHGRGCTWNCPGSLTHGLCRNGGQNCVLNGSFCEKCGINIRPQEMTYRCRACDCDVCEWCVGQASIQSARTQ